MNNMITVKRYLKSVLYFAK